MDRKSIELYKKALEEGQEKDYNIRIMVVGPYGVGKTSVTKRLLNQEVNIEQRESTDGIDVHVRNCKVSLHTKKWIVESAGTYIRLFQLRSSLTKFYVSISSLMFCFRCYHM